MLLFFIIYSLSRILDNFWLKIHYILFEFLKFINSLIYFIMSNSFFFIFIHRKLMHFIIKLKNNFIIFIVVLQNYHIFSFLIVNCCSCENIILVLNFMQLVFSYRFIDIFTIYTLKFKTFSNFELSFRQKIIILRAYDTSF